METENSVSNLETQKDITYSIVIPADSSVSGEAILAGEDIKTREGGFPGERMLFWLVAKWGEETSYLGKMDWTPQLFTTEITNVEFSDHNGHISTRELISAKSQRSSIIREFSAAVPLFTNLPKRPVDSATLSVWKDDFSTLVISSAISITLPVVYTSTFSTEADGIRIGFDFSNSKCEVNDYDLHFVPSNKVKMSDYEESFALRKIRLGLYELSFATSTATRLLDEMKLGLSVTWGGKNMISNFAVEIPIPKSALSIVWTVPPLKRLRQAKLTAEVQNISKEEIDVVLEIGKTVLLPLESRIEVKNIQPDEKRTVVVPCVPTIVGVHDLEYRMQIQERWYRPLFKTVVEIA